MSKQEESTNAGDNLNQAEERSRIEALINEIGTAHDKFVQTEVDKRLPSCLFVAAVWKKDRTPDSPSGVHCHIRDDLSEKASPEDYHPETYRILEQQLYSLRRSHRCHYDWGMSVPALQRTTAKRYNGTREPNTYNILVEQNYDCQGGSWRLVTATERLKYLTFSILLQLADDHRPSNPLQEVIIKYPQMRYAPTLLDPTPELPFELAQFQIEEGSGYRDDIRRSAEERRAFTWSSKEARWIARCTMPADLRLLNVSLLYGPAMTQHWLQPLDSAADEADADDDGDDDDDDDET